MDSGGIPHLRSASVFLKVFPTWVSDPTKEHGHIACGFLVSKETDKMPVSLFRGPGSR